MGVHQKQEKLCCGKSFTRYAHLKQRYGKKYPKYRSLGVALPDIRPTPQKVIKFSWHKPPTAVT